MENYSTLPVMQTNQPAVSVVIPTRNRGKEVVNALVSVLANDHPNFELILIDQSTDRETQDAVASLHHDPRFRYIGTNTCGTGRSRHMGLVAARGECVLYTDDDCIVPVDWISTMERVFNRYPKAAVFFCNVAPGAHNAAEGYIPSIVLSKTIVIRNALGVLNGLGLGAGMALRRSAVLAFGGIDTNMGPGSMFQSGEDHDVALRAVINHWWVIHTPETTVTHYGFRSWQDGKRHSKRDWFSIGATGIKPILCGNFTAIFYLLSRPFVRALLSPFGDLFRLRKPSGFGRALYLLQGMAFGIRVPVDRKYMLYKPEAQK